MTFLQAILLGIVQGLTEFLPISSSAHLVLTPFLLNWELDSSFVFAFDVLVQLGTLAAVIAYFWADLIAILRAWIAGLLSRQPFLDEKARLGWILILSTIPAILLGLLIKDLVEQAFISPSATGIFLLGTAVLLAIAEHIGHQQRELGTINWKDSLWIGFFQALSLFPGISRSGATITGGMIRNLDRVSAARFSFLMSIPVMLAAGVYTSLDLLTIPHFFTMIPAISIGFIAAAITGYLSIRWLLSFLVSRTLYPFAIYCALVGSLSLLVYFLRGG
jgi:undecaprenyl-diphosphatase